MKNIVRIAIASSVALCALTASLAVPRLESPRPIERVRGYSTIDSKGSVLPLGIGTPKSFAMGDTWVTSNMLDSDYVTDVLWYDNEILSVFGGFYTASSQDVTTFLQVKSQAGAIVFSGTFSGTPVANSINYIVLEVGTYPAGAYKVIMRFKQGSKVVGQQYWIGVFTP